MSESPHSPNETRPQVRADGLGGICVSVAAASLEEVLARLRDLPPSLPFVEVRLDYLPEPATALPALARVTQSQTDRQYLMTCRPRTSGGRFTGGPTEELAVLTAAADAGFPLVDLSLESVEALGSQAIAQLRAAGTTVLVSFHDFAGMGDLEPVLSRMRDFAPDLIKLVPTAKTLDDSLDLLAFVEKHRGAGAERALVAMAMGEAGTLTRLLGLRSGSHFTFAPITEAEATAPGQIAAAPLRELYRVERLGAATRLFGVAGDPVRSSLSPLMFNTAFREAGLDAVYLPLLTQDPQVLLRAAHELPLEGLSITMPLKQAVLPLLAGVEPLVRRIGAVNTVFRRNGQLFGDNTDVAGIVTPLEQRLSLRGARVLVLGAGGAARAAVFGCVDRGAQVIVTNRSPERAAELAAEAGAAFLPIESVGRESFDALIHATPAGMRGNASVLPFAEEQLRADVVFDLVYNPMQTPLLELARRKGLVTIAGIEMFLYQGARQYEIWTGTPAPLALMTRTVREALGAREAA